MDKARTLILYVTHQDCYNLEVFIKRGLIDSPDKHFIFTFNNPSPDLKRWSFLHSHPNVTLFVRPNIGHDFQGWNEALHLPETCLKKKIVYANAIEPNLTFVSDFIKYGNPPDKSSSSEVVGDYTPCFPEEFSEKDIDLPVVKLTSSRVSVPVHTLFDKFVFINSTVAGPYLPTYVPLDWADCFTSKLSDTVKITGISANCMAGHTFPDIQAHIKQAYNLVVYDHSHIQSMAYSLDREGLGILLRHKLFYEGKRFPADKWTLICTAEIAMSSLLRAEGKSIFAYMMGHGLITCHEIRRSNDWWGYKGFYPICEMMFVKDNNINTFPERKRYDDSLYI